MIQRVLKFFLRLLPAVVVALAVLQVAMINELAGLGRSVSILDAKIDSARASNELLVQKVASSSSLLAIEVKARENGFIEPTQSSYISFGNLPIALNGSE